MKWNGRYFRPGYGINVYPKKEDSIEELLKPLSEKTKKGNVWIPVLNQPINVLKENVPVVSPSITPSISVTPSISISPSVTPSISVSLTPSISTSPPPPSATPSITPSASLFTPEYQAVLTVASGAGYTLPSASQQTAQNQLMSDLVSSGIYSKMDVFHVYACDGDDNFTLINWRQPGILDGTLTGSPGRYLNEGWGGTGSNTDYINTNFNLQTGGAFTQNDNTVGVWDLYDDNSSGNGLIGTTNIAGFDIQNFATQNQYNNSSTFLVSAYNFNGHVGWKASSRISSNSSVTLAKGTSYQIVSQGSATPQNTDLKVLRSNTNSTTTIVSMVFIGSSLSTAEQTTLQGYFSSYMGSL